MPEMTPEYRKQIAEMLARPYPQAMATRASASAVLAAARALWDENERLRDSIAYLEAEPEGHRARQREAEDALAILLTREGGSTEITQAEMASLDRRGSFVLSRTVMGGERLAYVTGEQKPTAAAQHPADRAESTEVICGFPACVRPDHQAGQPWTPTERGQENDE